MIVFPQANDIHLFCRHRHGVSGTEMCRNDEGQMSSGLRDDVIVLLLNNLRGMNTRRSLYSDYQNIVICQYLLSEFLILYIVFAID